MVVGPGRRSPISALMMQGEMQGEMLHLISTSHNGRVPQIRKGAWMPKCQHSYKWLQLWKILEELHDGSDPWRMPVSHWGFRGERQGDLLEDCWGASGRLWARWAGEEAADVKAYVGINLPEASGNPL